MSIHIDPVVHYPDEVGNFTPPDVVWCHLISTVSEADLTAFAISIGIDPVRLRIPPDTTQTHYNLTEPERELAVAAGAIETSGRAIYGLGFDSPGIRGSF